MCTPTASSCGHQLHCQVTRIQNVKLQACWHASNNTHIGALNATSPHHLWPSWKLGLRSLTTGCATSCWCHENKHCVLVATCYVVTRSDENQLAKKPRGSLTMRHSVWSSICGQQCSAPIRSGSCHHIPYLGVWHPTKDGWPRNHQLRCSALPQGGKRGFHQCSWEW